jgi:hypothetical protein
VEGELLVWLCFDDAEDDPVEVPEAYVHEAKRIWLGPPPLIRRRGLFGRWQRGGPVSRGIKARCRASVGVQLVTNSVPGSPLRSVDVLAGGEPEPARLGAA